MFEGLIEKIKSMSAGRERFDPSSLNDPVAMKTDWGPAKGGGTNIRTHRLVAVGSNRMEFRSCIGAILFYLVFLVMGLGVMTAFLVSNISSGGMGFNMETIFPVLIGLVFASVGGGMFYFGTAPIVFDQSNGCFWKGRKNPSQVYDKASIKYFAELDQVHAVQLVSEYCSGSKSSYYSYELNLVLNDGARVNVVDHGNRRKLQEDAQVLAEFLGKPVWDSI
jgi:hypothetical protein